MKSADVDEVDTKDINMYHLVLGTFILGGSSQKTDYVLFVGSCVVKYYKFAIMLTRPRINAKSS